MTRTSNHATLATPADASPIAENGKVVRLNVRKQRTASTPRPPKRRTNAEVRSREYLTPDEVKRVMKAAGAIGRHGHRDRCLILIGYRHALRVTVIFRRNGAIRFSAYRSQSIFGVMEPVPS